MVDGRKAAALTCTLLTAFLLAAPPVHAQNPEGCQAFPPSAAECTYTATENGGIAGYAPEPGGWKVTIVKKGEKRPIVVTSLGGFETYTCGTIAPGDKVTAAATEGSGVTVGNPGICL